jgi:glycine/D-amino acid oxidase-like deaminating enzyme
MAVQQGMEEISPAAAKAKFPLLKDGYARRAVLDPGTADIDVDLLHQSYLRLFRQRGGTLHCDRPVTALEKNGRWTVRTGEVTLQARHHRRCGRRLGRQGGRNGGPQADRASAQAPFHCRGAGT